ncbi:glycoside hydrolase family 2 TIM barrel-domain containing protein [Microbacterium sp. DT81.1]|uniref:glycoside hydrolase family 2 TIM barrel-domain containing protein n=1 Tax=Microbacterium sp. DT81.1 TaxID=3393413 RepID=UPI003CF9E80F
MAPSLWPETWPTDHPDYPRRRMQRREWQSLNGIWEFAVAGGVEHPSAIPAWDRQIIVPFAPESVASGIDDRTLGADVWYRREIEYTRRENVRLLLHFGAVDYRARVWVDGRFVGQHEGGHTPFWFDITDALKKNREVHEIAVWAHDEPQGLAQPRGKQDWQDEPHSIWYPRTTGIWQTVWLEEVPSRRLSDVRLTSHLDRWTLGFEARLYGPDRGEDLRVRLRLSVGDRLLADDLYDVQEEEVHRRVALADPGIDDSRNELLWSPDSPTLIRAEVWLLDGDQVMDEIRSYTAMRGVNLQRGRMLLNNRPYPMRLVLDQGYWPDTLMTPPSEEALIRDIELTKAAGFNGVRKHQKVEDPRYLYWADVLGLLVWEEMPSAYRFTRDSVERLTREWVEVIDRDSGHPCIVVWVPFNESWGVPDLPNVEKHRSFVQSLYHLTRTLDPSRPVVGNDGWESTATDILTIHDYESDPARLLARYARTPGGGLPEALRSAFPAGRVITLDEHPHDGQPVVLSEFGGIACRTTDEPGGAWGYSVTGSSQELRATYEQLLSAVHESEMFAGFCYTQLTDTFQEANGLFTAQREPKFDIRAMHRATRGVRQHPAEVPVEAVDREPTS